MIPRSSLITVAETPLFLRQASDVWTNEERAQFINYIAANPEAGDIIPETGGLRKLRWGRSGSGKRGGVRVIYYFHDGSMPIYLLALYAKARQADMTADEKRRVTALVAALRHSKRRTTP